MEKQVAGITRNLLRSGAFSHLSDAELARLQWLLMGKLQNQSANQLMQYWYCGNYFTQGVPQHLLHDCNLLLVHAGKPAIDVFIEEEFEA